MAHNITVIVPTTGAVATKAPFESGDYQNVTVAADVLAGAETCTLWINAGATWVPATNPNTGAAATLTATVPSMTLPGGPYYAVTKAATVGACGVYVNYGPR